MSTIVRIQLGARATTQPPSRVVTKGAPEVIEALLAVVPSTYRAVYTHFTRRGSRVIALCYRDLDGVSAGDVQQMSRAEAEAPSSATFAGFLISECPLKKDSAKVIKRLQQSAHRVVMITGDNADTACAVARRVGIVPKPPKSAAGSLAGAREKKTPELRLVAGDGGAAPRWVSSEQRASVALDADASRQVRELAEAGNALCVTGPALAQLCAASRDDASRDALVSALALNVAVWARTSPDQKDMVVAGLNRCVGARRRLLLATCACSCFCAYTRISSYFPRFLLDGSRASERSLTRRACTARSHTHGRGTARGSGR